MPRSNVCSVLYCDSKTASIVEPNLSSFENSDISSITYHSVPKNEDMRRAWISAVNGREGAKQTTPWIPADCSAVCSKHFVNEDFEQPGILKHNSVPSVFPTNPLKSNIIKKQCALLPKSRKRKIQKQGKTNEAQRNENNKSVQVGVVSYKQEQLIKKIELENKLLQQENDMMVNQIASYKTTYKNLMEEINSSEFRQLEEVKKCAGNGNVKAIFLLDQLYNFEKRQLNWTDVSLQQCTKWRESSGKGYSHVRARNLVSCPSRSTLERFAMGEKTDGTDDEYSSLEESTSEVTIEIQTADYND